MAVKPVRFRVLASDDLGDAVAFYHEHGGAELAQRFVDSVEAAVQRIGRRPTSGSLRFAYELSIPDLRAVTTARFPYALFYVERSEAIEVWRLLHTSRDIPHTLSDSPDR